MDARLRLEDLAEQVGVEKRTVRSYVQQGLLRGPEAKGRFAYYTPAHLARLKAIRFLRQLEGRSLDDIRPLLLGMTDEQVDELAGRFDAARAAGAGMVTGSESAMSALAYIESLKHRPGMDRGPAHLREPGPAHAASGRGSTAPGAPSPAPPRSVLTDMKLAPSRVEVTQDPSIGPPVPGETPIDRVLSALEEFNGRRSVPAKARGEGWVVICITPDLELHVRGVNRADQLARLERIADHLREALTGGMDHG